MPRPIKYTDLDRPFRIVYAQVPLDLHKRFHRAATKEGKRSLAAWVIEKLTLAVKGQHLSDRSPSSPLDSDLPTT